MKQITLLIVLVLGYASSNAQFLEDFNSGTFPPTGWAVYNGANGLGTTELWVQAGAAPNFRAQNLWEAVTPGQLAEDWLVSPLIPINAMQNNLEFDATDLNQGEFGSVLSIRVSTTSQTNTATFVEVASFNESQLGNNPNAAFSTFNVSLGAFLGQSVYVAFVHVQNDGDAVTVDNVEVVQGAAAPPLATANPNPADMATGVVVDTSDANMDGINDNSVQFSWTPGIGIGEPADDYEIFLGDSATTLVSIGATPNLAVNITGLQYNTTYFWQAVARNTAGSALNSSVWSFTTEVGNITAPPAVTNMFPLDMTNAALDTSDQNMDNNPDNAVVFEWDLPTTGDPIENVIFNLGVTATDLTAFVSGRGPTAETLRLSGLADNTTYYWRIDTRNVGGDTLGPVFEFTTDSTLSFDGAPITENGSLLAIGPNPVSNELNLFSSESLKQVSIYNSLGQRVLNIDGENLTSVDVTDLEKGIYLLKGQSEAGEQTIKFIKN